MIAFMYNMSAVISKGSKISMTRKKYMSNLGIWIKGRIKSKKGAANPTRTHAMRYSLFSTSDFLLSASADATKKALSRDSRIQFKADHEKLLTEFIICRQDARVTENIKTEQTTRGADSLSPCSSRSNSPR